MYNKLELNEQNVIMACSVVVFLHLSGRKSKATLENSLTVNGKSSNTTYLLFFSYYQQVKKTGIVKCSTYISLI
jgi:hypothetical protein